MQGKDNRDSMDIEPLEKLSLKPLPTQEEEQVNDTLQKIFGKGKKVKLEQKNTKMASRHFTSNKVNVNLDVLENGATLLKTQFVEGVTIVMPITSAEDKAQRRLERFGRNAATKKTQRNLLKQQYENFTASNSEMLDQTFDRLQKLMSQLEILGEKLSHEDANQKLLRSLSPEWNTHAMLWCRVIVLVDMIKVIKMKMTKLCTHSIHIFKFLLKGYKSGLNSLEERLEFFKKNKFIYLEDIKVLKVEIQMKEIAITELRMKLQVAQKEKDDIQITVEKLENASKSLNKLIDCQIVDNCKKGLGYESYNVVSPPYTGNFMPPKPDLSYIGLDKFVVKPVVKNKSSEEETKAIRKNTYVLIIKKWVSDDEEENVTQPKIVKKIVKPSIVKKEFVKPRQQEKTTRKTVKKVEHNRQNTHRPIGNKRNWNNMMSQNLGSNFEMFNKACYVCGSIDHLQADCHYHQKQFQNQKMVKQVWNNAQRTMNKLMVDMLLLEGTPKNGKSQEKDTIKTGSRPDWLFDIDAITRTMKYEPIVAGTQLNDFVDPKSSQDDRFKPSNDDGKKVDEDLRKENEYNELLFDPNMHALEDISTFNFSSDHEDDDAVADMNNLDITIQKTDGAMINSIQNGDQPMPVIAQVSLAGNAQNAPPTLKDPKFWTAKEKKTRKIDSLARSLFIQGLPSDIYSLIDSNETAKDQMDALEREMCGSKYGEQDRKAAILYEYETFKATEGDQLLDTYLRYLQVINDLKKCGYKKDNCELNYKFLNNLQPKWKQYAILMRQTKNLMDINIDALYNILKQNQGDVNDVMGYKKKAIMVTLNPLALVAEKTKVSKQKEKVVVSSDYEGSGANDFSELKKIIALLAKAFNRRKAIAEVSYYTSESESEYEFETSEYYDNFTNYGLFVNNDDDQDVFHDAINSASENFIENHIDSKKHYDKSEVDHNDSEEKEHLVDKLIRKFNHKIAKCFENPGYFGKAKNLRPSLYDEKVIGLGYTPMFLIHSNEALEIKKFKRARENKIEFAYDYGNLNASYVNEKINLLDNYFQEIINPDFEKIDSPFQQTSSLKPYVSTVILEKIIIDLEDEVVSLLEKEKANLKTIESLKSKGFESSENAIFDSENQSENDCHVVEKECDQVENSKVITPGMFKLSVSQNVSPISMTKTSCDSKSVENLDTFSSVRRPKHSGVIWKKKGSSNTFNVDLSSVSHSKLNKDFNRYSRKDLLSCNNSHLGETSSAYVCNNAMNVSCNSRMCDLFDENNLFIFDDESVKISPVSKMPFTKKPRDSMNVRSKSNSYKSLPRTVHRWLPKMQLLAEPVAKWIPRVERLIDKISKPPNSSGPIYKWVPKIVQICLWIIDSGCSKHMTGNRDLLTNFVEKFLGTVRFGNNDFAVIDGYGDVVIG
nr:integrase, catalytic region, zinc finger, CCHC-type, peptidase aspartic, catalytic [Tanacetum cinerariifolium]